MPSSDDHEAAKYFHMFALNLKSTNNDDNNETHEKKKRTLTPEPATSRYKSKTPKTYFMLRQHT